MVRLTHLIRRAPVACAFLVALTWAFLLAAIAPAQAQDAPTSIAGITLGANIEDLGDAIVPGSTVPLWGQEWLQRSEVAVPPGYRSGYVTSGACAHKGRVVRIKMSYEDESLDFFNQLLGALKKRYGSNPEWRGDPFGTERTWKWSLSNAQGESVSLILQYYSGSEDSATPGVSIRLANRDLMAQEEDCAKDSGMIAAREKKARQDAKKFGLDYFLPQ